MENYFDKLRNINVNGRTEKKNGLTYLSWAFAVDEFKKVCPNMTYEIKKFENGLPYVYDPKTGYMVFTSVTVDGLTHEMWLPVMDGNNKAMKAEPYTVHTKYKDIEVQAATMFDINKTIMRCLTKNFAMFGLGLYIYAGEDLPEAEDDTKAKATETIDAKAAGTLGVMLANKNVNVDKLLAQYKVKALTELTSQQYGDIIRRLSAGESK